jgi:probable addiction module antidote protein
MPKRTKSYEESLLEDLRNPEKAAAYLSVSLEEPGAPDSEALFLLALHNVAKAHGISELALAAGLNRESLYRTLSPRGNPKVTTLMHLLGAMGLRLGVQVATRRKHSAKPHSRRPMKKAS